MSDPVAKTSSMKNVYIYDYLNKGSTKFVFTAGVYPRNRMIEYKNDNKESLSLEVEQLQQIYVGIYDIKKVQKPSFGTGISVVVSCIMTNTPEEYRECIENIRLQEKFYSYQMATKIYGIVIMEEVKTLVSQKEPSSEKAKVEPNEIIEYKYHRWNITDDRESDFDRFLPTAHSLVNNGFKKTFFVFQERCDFDVVKYVKNEIEKKTRIWDGMYPIKSEFETIVDKIDDNMSIHVKKYIKHGYIDTDYKPGNVCIIQSTGSASAVASSVAAASSSHDEQIWTGFDFDIKFVHDIKGLDKTSFKQNCELYMIIQFYVTFSYIVVSYREHFVPIILEILQTKHKITKKTINDIVYYFYNINTHFIEQYTTEYNTDIFTPYRSLLDYASRYFTINILNTLDPVEQERIMDEQKHNTPKYLVNAICAIFGFVGTPKSSPKSSPKSMSVPLSMSSPKSRKSSAKPGGRKVNSSKKHLNKRASTNTNAITKKSKSKRTLVK